MANRIEESALYGNIYDYINNIENGSMKEYMPRDLFIHYGCRDPYLINLDRIYEAKNSDFLMLKAYIELLGRPLDQDGEKSWYTIREKCDPDDFVNILIYELLMSEEGRKRREYAVVSDDKWPISKNVAEYILQLEDTSTVDIMAHINRNVSLIDFVQELSINALDRPLSKKEFAVWKMFIENHKRDDVIIKAIMDIVYSKEAKKKKKTIINNDYYKDKLTGIHIIMTRSARIPESILNFAYYKIFLNLPDGVKSSIIKHFKKGD